MKILSRILLHLLCVCHRVNFIFRALPVKVSRLLPTTAGTASLILSLRGEGKPPIGSSHNSCTESS